MTRATAVAFVGLVVASLYAPAAARSVPVERVVYLMGTRVTLTVDGVDRVSAAHQLEGMVQSLEATESDLSTWRAESALSAVNRQPVGEPVALPAPVCSLWPALVAWHGGTGGAFDPTVGALSEIWGLRAGGRRPATGEIAAALAVTGFEHVEFDPAACRVTRLAEVTLDAGAFGKGEALRRLHAEFRDHAPWRVDLGGQIAVSGRPPDGRWLVSVAHPRRRGQPVLDILLDTGSLATSGASERSFEAAGTRFGHIVDPRTGQALLRPESVTVWHDDPLAADILSTALYVMGVGEGLRYAEAHGLAALFLSPSPVDDDAPPSACPSPAFLGRFAPDGAALEPVASTGSRHGLLAACSVDPSGLRSASREVHGFPTNHANEPANRHSGVGP